MKLRKILATKNNCYKANKSMKPKGVVVHSTGANNPNLCRYVGPDDGNLGTESSNSFNHAKPGGRSVCVHAFIGKCKDGSIATYQILPFDIRCWGCGSGSKGSYNDGYIQFEICEDDLKSKSYFDKVYKEAVEFCVHLCKLYPSISTSNIVCHCEAHDRGYASNHGDVMHWFPKFGKSMDTFRSDVKKQLQGKTTSNKTNSVGNTSSGSTYKGSFKVRTKCELNIRKTPKVEDDNIVGLAEPNVYTIVKTHGSWGYLKSGAGWINISSTYATRL